jgi:hypothetical protein
MADMMKMMGQNKRGGPMAGLANTFGLGGGMPSPEEIAAMQKQMGGGAALPEFPGAAKAPTAPAPCPVLHRNYPDYRALEASRRFRGLEASTRSGGRKSEKPFTRHCER